MSDESVVVDSEQLRAGNILCFLHDTWQEGNYHPGRLRGEEYKYKYAVVACTHCWGLCEHRTNGTLIYHRYASNISDLCMFFRINARVRVIEGLHIVKSALDKICGKIDIGLKNCDSSIDEAIDFAQKIDLAYRLDFAMHDDVRTRIFKYSTTELDSE